MSPRVYAGTLAALLASLAAPIPLHGAAAGRGTAPASASAPATSTAPASASAPASRPALQADVILSKFPANAAVLAARSDARNFTIEGRVRDVRTVTVDAAGTALGPGVAAGTGGTKTELRIVLVGRSQADDAPPHFTCRFDKATEEAAGKLKPDQIVRFTGSIGTAAAAMDRIDLLNCHDLFRDRHAQRRRSTRRPMAHCNDIQVDGPALRKANQARGIKADDTPDSNYPAPWQSIWPCAADGTLAAELAENNGQSLKRLTGRCQILKDGPSEARLRLNVQGTASQEAAATFEAGRLKLTLPGLADKFVLPDTRFGKLDGTLRPWTTAAFKDQTMQWFNANVTANNPTLPKFVSNAIDQRAGFHQGFIFTLGAGTVRRGKTALVVGAYGKLLTLEYSTPKPWPTTPTGPTSTTASSRTGLPYGAEVKIEALAVDNRGLRCRQTTRR